MRVIISVLLVSFCLLFNGCIAFYRHRPIDVSVYDAETDAPIPGANVLLSYRYVMVFNGPHATHANTNQQGVAHVDATTFELQVWSVSKEGYIAYETRGAPPRNKEKPFAFQLYRVPKPQIIITIPAKFHGALKIEMHPIERAIQDEIGKRTFVFAANSDGQVTIDATPLLLRMNMWENVTVQFDDGTALPSYYFNYGPQPNTVALHFVENIANRTLLVVGTAQDLDSVNSQIYTPIHGDPHNTALNLQAFNALFDTKSDHTPPKNP